MVKTLSKHPGKKIPYETVELPPGDVAAFFVDPAYAKATLNLKAKLDINSMCRYTWNWQSKNPNSYN